MPRVLITGAAGFIGMHTSILFLNKGWDVVGLDNINDYYSVQLKENRLKQIYNHAIDSQGSFTFFKEDLNSDVWSSLTAYRFGALIHLAAQAGVRYSIDNPSAYLQSNILGFQRVLDFVESNSIVKFLYASSSSVYGKNSKVPFQETESCDQPESYYAATKRANELMAASYYATKGVVSIGLRFFTVYGPWGRPDMAPYIFTKAAMNGKEIEVYNYGNQMRDFTYIDDITTAIYGCIENFEKTNPPQILNIGAGSPTRLMDFIGAIEIATKTKIKTRLIPAQLGDVPKTYADTTKLISIIGETSTISLNDGIHRFVEWYIRNREFLE